MRKFAARLARALHVHDGCRVGVLGGCVAPVEQDADDQAGDEEDGRPPVGRGVALQAGSGEDGDFFVAKYDSPLLGALVALVGVVAMVPYLVLQLKGLGIIVSVDEAHPQLLTLPSSGTSASWFASTVLLTALVPGSLLLMGYALVTQLFPALLASLAPRRIVTEQGAAAGIVVGVTTVAVVTLPSQGRFERTGVAAPHRGDR